MSGNAAPEDDPYVLYSCDREDLYLYYVSRKSGAALHRTSRCRAFLLACAVGRVPRDQADWYCKQYRMRPCKLCVGRSVVGTTRAESDVV